MNFVKTAFFLLISAVSLYAKVQVSYDTLNKTKTGIDFYGETSYYFTTAKLLAVSKQVYTVNGFEVSEIILEIESSASQVKIYHMRSLSLEQIQQASINTVKSNIESTSFDIREVEKASIQANKKLKNVVSTNTHIQLPEVVAKVYPTSTHSKTIEFAIHDIDDLNLLYTLIQKSFSDKASDKKLTGTLFKIIKQ